MHSSQREKNEIRAYVEDQFHPGVKTDRFHPRGLCLLPSDSGVGVS